jgi:hypothetical protein
VTPLPSPLHCWIHRLHSDTTPMHFYFWSRGEVTRLIEACSRASSGGVIKQPAPVATLVMQKIAKEQQRVQSAGTRTTAPAF